MAMRNLLRHPQKNVLLSSLIIIVIASLFIANAVFEGSNTGLESTFRKSFTGDLAISESVNTTISLFGNELPIVSEYEKIAPISQHSRIMSIIKDLPEEIDITSIISVPARMEIMKYRINVPLFGVEPQSYFKLCSDISIEKGNVRDLSHKGVFLNSIIVEKAEKALGRPLNLGEEIRFSIYDGNSFRIRSVPFSGVHKYPGTTEALERVVLTDVTTARSLANYTLGFSSENVKSEDKNMFSSIDDLFLEDLDIVDDSTAELNLEEIETSLNENNNRESLLLSDNGAWSFILLKLNKNKINRVRRELRNRFKEAEIDINIMSWRTAAGSTAQILFAVQAIFYLGLGFIAVGAVLVIMNALVISVMERTNEIGTMRSIGADVGLIRKLFITESMILTIGSGFAGILIAVLAVTIGNRVGLTVKNHILISLFGSSKLILSISLKSVFLHLLLVASVGTVSWVYPVSLAIKIQPVTAMSKN